MALLLVLGIYTRSRERRGGKGERKSRDAATVDGDSDLYTARWRGAAKHDTVPEVPRAPPGKSRSLQR
jgi:hypothetical protein